MTTSILLRSPQHLTPSPSPSPSPASTPLPALQTDLSSSSSSSTSGSCLDLQRASSAPSTRRIRFAPLPDPRRDLFDTHDSPFDDSQSATKLATQTVPAPSDLHDDFVALSPSISPSSTLSSARSTPTIRTSHNAHPKTTSISHLKLLRPFSFLRRATLSSPNRSPLSQSSSLPGSRNPSPSSLRTSSSVPNSPSFHSPKLSRISTDDLTFGAKSFFRSRSGSASGTRPPRTSSPPPRPLDPTKSLHRPASTGSGPGMKLDNRKHDWGEGSSQSYDTSIAGSGPKKRRASSSALTPGAGGGRHASSAKLLPGDSPVRPSTAPSSSLAPPKKHVRMLNGRIYGARGYAAQTLANPFANVRDEPEFVEWGYGGMGNVHASAGIANDMWKGLQHSERGGALLAGSSFGSPSASTRPITGAITAGGGRGSGARATLPISRRKMSDNVPECGMGNVGAGAGLDEDDGSGMRWVKRRRAEREAKARLEQGAKELEKKAQEGRKSGDSMDASMYASTASITTSLTACTSAASTDLTTPTTSPLTSRSPSVTDLKLTSSPFSESCDLGATQPRTVAGEQSSKSDTPYPAPVSKDEHGHHVLTAVRLSPNISSSSHKHSHSMTHRTSSLSHSLSQIGEGIDNGNIEQVAPLSPVGTEEEEEERSRGSNEEEEQDDGDDDEEEETQVCCLPVFTITYKHLVLQDIRRKTALGAGVEKISRHVDIEAR
ncbi:hypothetical protein J3R83DRAFT_1751 [Lanmaoa asiatica]|nr:hypothetical protein J3R83DRAFT_1751 [Lanmaoa asiatica]